MTAIHVVQMGLGPIGLAITPLLMQREGIDIVAAIDIDPDKQQQDLGTLAGMDAIGVKVTDDVSTIAAQNADVAIVTTTSSIETFFQQIKPILAAGISVLSTCEELSYPWKRHALIAKEIDDFAKVHQVAVLGTGINPGFLMDFLPVMTTAISERVDCVTVRRVQDASQRRLAFQQKVGVGFSQAEFKEALTKGVLGHVGLTESLHYIAAYLGIALDKISDDLAPVIAERDYAEDDLQIAAGDCLGVLQVMCGFSEGKKVIELEFKASAFEPQAVDEIIISGEPCLHLMFPQAVNGDRATAAIVCNAVRALVAADDGLRVMGDVLPYYR